MSTILMAVEPYLKLTDKYKLKVHCRCSKINWATLNGSAGDCHFFAIPPWGQISAKKPWWFQPGTQWKPARFKKMGGTCKSTGFHTIKGRITAWEMWNEPTVKMRGKRIHAHSESGCKRCQKRLIPISTLSALLPVPETLGGDPLGWGKKALDYSDDPKSLMDTISVSHLCIAGR